MLNKTNFVQTIYREVSRDFNFFVQQCLQEALITKKRSGVLIEICRINIEEVD
jgi:hypothetical protein